jgi:hypothetical protein
MKFKNYCVVFMGDTTNALLEISQVSEIPPNIIDAKGIFIATITSGLNVGEISDFFNTCGKSFLVFELDGKTSGVKITKDILHDKLFGFLNTNNKQKLSEKSDNFLQSIKISSDTTNNKTTIKEIPITKNMVNKMSISEKEELQNKIIDKGVSNITEQDKIILDYLWKNS